ncbi:hypothetical protein B0H16DRAFT_1471175 [Mycena metata]|uniref:Uncharacterized protein n=1 Tax=Mycena metata TaxID=1033252 RepID=A0AAD7HTN6_9AGAR|nr:hypothetical protein B0H16DRAFT_1471175 [Mycena metata]
MVAPLIILSICALVALVATPPVILHHHPEYLLAFHKEVHALAGLAYTTISTDAMVTVTRGLGLSTRYLVEATQTITAAVIETWPEFSAGALRFVITALFPDLPLPGSGMATKHFISLLLILRTSWSVLRSRYDDLILPKIIRGLVKFFYSLRGKSEGLSFRKWMVLSCAAAFLVAAYWYSIGQHDAEAARAEAARLDDADDDEAEADAKQDEVHLEVPTAPRAQAGGDSQDQHLNKGVVNPVIQVPAPKAAAFGRQSGQPLLIPRTLLDADDFNQSSTHGVEGDQCAKLLPQAPYSAAAYEYGPWFPEKRRMKAGESFGIESPGWNFDDSEHQISAAFGAQRPGEVDTLRAGTVRPMAVNSEPLGPYPQPQYFLRWLVFTIDLLGHDAHGSSSTCILYELADQQTSTHRDVSASSTTGEVKSSAALKAGILITHSKVVLALSKSHFELTYGPGYAVQKALVTRKERKQAFVAKPKAMDIQRHESARLLKGHALQHRSSTLEGIPAHSAEARREENLQLIFSSKKAEQGEDFFPGPCNLKQLDVGCRTMVKFLFLRTSPNSRTAAKTSQLKGEKKFSLPVHYIEPRIHSTRKCAILSRIHRYDGHRLSFSFCIGKESLGEETTPMKSTMQATTITAPTAAKYAATHPARLPTTRPLKFVLTAHPSVAATSDLTSSSRLTEVDLSRVKSRLNKSEAPGSSRQGLSGKFAKIDLKKPLFPVSWGLKKPHSDKGRHMGDLIFWPRLRRVAGAGDGQRPTGSSAFNVTFVISVNIGTGQVEEIQRATDLGGSFPGP